MMKKVLTLALAALLLLSLLAACGGGSGKYAGTYVVTKLADWTIQEYADIFDATVEEIQETMKIELKKDGKAVFSMDDEPTEVNWKVDGDKIILSADGEEMTGTIKDKVISLDFDGEVVEFTKK